MLITNADLGGVRVDVRFDRKILEVKADIQPLDAEQVIDARGGALLPGLHDHHMHFLATAAQASSVDCGGPLVDNQESLGRLLRQQAGSDCLRGVNYHESTAGELLRWTLDELIDDRPVRIQHSSGKVWMLNSAAAESIDLQSFSWLEGVEVDAHGVVTGRLFRLDGWLRSQFSSSSQNDISGLSLQLASYGITGFTDASATNSKQTATQFAEWQEQGLIRQKCLLMGDDSLNNGHLKVLLDEDALPCLDDLILRLQSARKCSRPIAFHCVSHVELLYALTALAQVGVDSRDRIEHASVVYNELLPMLKQQQVALVTQPGFLVDRGDRYLRDLDELELEHLYRNATLQQQQIPVALSSDATYGPLNPWVVMDSAVRRCSQSGVSINPWEQLTPSEALRGYSYCPSNPGRVERVVQVGEPADLCLLEQPWEWVSHNLGDTKVRASFVDGRVIYRLDE